MTSIRTPDQTGLVVCHKWIDGWPGLEGLSPKPRGFLRFAQSSPGHPIHQSKRDSYAASLGIVPGDVIFRMGITDVNTAADVKKGIEEAKKNQRILLYIKTSTGTRFISVPLLVNP